MHFRPTPRRWLTTASALAGALLLTLPGCAEAPIRAKYQAKNALASARAARAEELAPEALEAADQAYAAGIRETDLQLDRMRWSRSFVRAETLFEASLRRARLAEARGRRQQQETRERAHRLLVRAEAGFEQMDWLSIYLPPRSRIRADVRKAAVSFEEARTHFDGGRYLRAADAARKANGDIALAYDRFSRFILSSADPGRRAQYDRWVRDTIRWSASNNARAIIVDKLRRTLTLVSDGRRVRTYRAELGINGTLNKVVAGDRATPEGRYRIVEKRGPRQTRWYKALLINYPNEDDLERFRRARRRGQISRRAGPGSLIEIHGEGGRGGDWTDGCVALVNRDMDHLFAQVAVGTPVTIVGFEVDEQAERAATRASNRSGSGRASAPSVSSSAGGLR